MIDTMICSAAIIVWHYCLYLIIERRVSQMQKDIFAACYMILAANGLIDPNSIFVDNDKNILE